MDATVITAIGGIAIGLGGLVFKMWQDHTRLAEKVVDVVERNAIANTKLAESSDRFSRILIDMSKKKAK